MDNREPCVVYVAWAQYRLRGTGHVAKRRDWLVEKARNPRMSAALSWTPRSEMLGVRFDSRSERIRLALPVVVQLEARGNLAGSRACEGVDLSATRRCLRVLARRHCYLVPGSVCGLAIDGVAPRCR